MAYGTYGHFRAQGAVNHCIPHGLRSWLSTVLLRAGHPNCSCFWLPPNKSSVHSEVPRLPSLEKSQGSTCLNQPMAPGQGKIEDTSPHSTHLWHRSEGFSSSTLGVPGLSPNAGTKGRGWAEALCQRREGSFNSKSFRLCSHPAQAGRVRPGGVGAIPMLHNKKGF